MTTNQPDTFSVGTIIYSCSDVIYLVRESIAEGKKIQSMSEQNIRNLVTQQIPHVVTIKQKADPLLSTFKPLQEGKLVSVLINSPILLGSIPHLYKLAHYPVVIHVSLQPCESPDISDITAIRNCGFYFVQPAYQQEAPDIALAAHALAIQTRKGVIYFSTYAEEDLTSGASGGCEIGSIVQNAKGVPVLVQTSTIVYADNDHKAILPALDQLSQQDNAVVATKNVSSADIHHFTCNIWSRIEEKTGRKYSNFEYIGSDTAEIVLFVFGADLSLFTKAIIKAENENIGIAFARLYRPWLGPNLVESLPSTVTKIAVLEQVHRKTTKWGPLLMDLLMSLRKTLASTPIIIGYQLGLVHEHNVGQVIETVIHNLNSNTPTQNLQVGDLMISRVQSVAQQPKAENAYTKILGQIFGNQLYIANQIDSKATEVSPHFVSCPEFGFGSLTARIERRQRFIYKVQKLTRSDQISNPETLKTISLWLEAADNSEMANSAASNVTEQLWSDNSPISQQLLTQKDLFARQSLWLIGSDAWAYDLGNSGVHQVIVSGANVNMLIIDSTLYSEQNIADAANRKKDIGLYAMNYGNAYVASVAVYSSYTQVLEAMIEADRFDGPSIVLAYLPYSHEDDSPLTILKETKTAVDIGHWPLYRWNPKAESSDDRFSLDSERLKKELEQFLRRDNYLTQVIRNNPEFANNLSGSYGSEVRGLQKRRAKDAYSKLLEGLIGAPMTVLFASDNGNAETLAKRLGNRGRARGLKTLVMAMDDYPIEDLCGEENLVLVTSTAGQGEFPQNGRNFWEAVRNSVDFDLTTVNFAVFALGDSHYWPRREDRIYYNKPGKDLHAKLVSLGGKALTEVGLGDDQDPDIYYTGYADWEAQLWKALDVDKVDGLPEEAPPLTNEDMKLASNYLRGTIAEGLQDTSTGAISASDQQLTKFHGTYMQDDRDVRDERKAQGLEPAYSFMIRCRLPGGVASPQQWIQMDDIASKLGNNSMKLTTRQTFQFHGVVKGRLRPAMQAINQALMTTIAACGDVNRNVMCSSLPQQSQYHSEVWAISKKISDHLLPSTTAYHEIWLQEDDGKKTQIAGDALQDFEPLYGPTYLPRKFKITIAIPPHNDTDVYAHDIGLIAIKGDDGHLEGFNLLAGGGMGATHNNKKTYPQIGRMFGYVTADQVHIACEKIMLIQRDYGDRKNRKHARLKYTIDEMGLHMFIEKVEELLGWKFAPARPFKFDSNIDTFGWQKDENGLNHFTFFIENGRVEDTAEFPMKTGLKAVAKMLRGEFRLTGNQHVILSNITNQDLLDVKNMLKKFKLDNTSYTGLRLSSSACVAFPTCGLAMAESERYLPELISKLEDTIFEARLAKDSIVMRMTGCPNGCARPWLAEVAFVGKAFGAYNMYLGGGYHGQRLNKLYRSSINEDEILEILRPLIRRYAREREEGERFGDFCIRVGMVHETIEGRDFHDNTAEVEEEE